MISHYRSYHGGTTGSLGATGDFRRHMGEAGAAGFVKAFGPSPWHFSMGRTEEEEADYALAMLEEQVRARGWADLATPKEHGPRTGVGARAWACRGRLP